MKTEKKIPSIPYPLFFSLLLFSVFCAVSYADAVVLRKSLPADCKTDGFHSGAWDCHHLSDDQFRQHDQADGIFSGSLDDIPALCFRDTLKGKDILPIFI